ncbi:MAG TPA: toll/interleukin-1 receptor domain-containing protein, partial [Polyangia bacterium]|nr:toll/interleukin-1 receptor domain-containing protein [Polyangia bacterium]
MDIFLSYSNQDRLWATGFAQVLGQRGWSVFWDRRIPFGRTFDRVIEDELDKAGCVVVLWSRNSVKSDWVRTEAAEGARRQIIHPV